MTALQDGKLGPGLKKFLTDQVLTKGKGKDSLVVAEPGIGALLVFIHFRPLMHLFCR